MRKSTPLALLFFLAASLFASCGGGASAAAGDWEVDKEALLESMETTFKEQAGEDNAGMLDMMLAQMKTMVEGTEMTMTLNADGTAKMISKGMGDDTEETGTWSMEDGKVKIETENTPAVFATLKGDTLTAKMPSDGDAGPMGDIEIIFKRK